MTYRSRTELSNSYKAEHRTRKPAVFLCRQEMSFDFLYLSFRSGRMRNTKPLVGNTHRCPCTVANLPAPLVGCLIQI